MECKNELHQDGSSGHLSRLVVQHGEDIALVISDHWDLDCQLVAFAHLQDEGNEDEGSQEFKRWDHSTSSLGSRGKSPHPL